MSQEEMEASGESLDDISTDEGNRFTAIFSGASKAVMANAVVFAFIVGGLCAWAFGGFGGVLPLLAFLIGGALAWKNIMGRANGWRAAGRGFQLSALVSFFLPFLFYMPTIFGTESGIALVGGLLGLIVWGVVFFFVAALFGVIGYGCNRRGAE